MQGKTAGSKLRQYIIGSTLSYFERANIYVGHMSYSCESKTSCRVRAPVPGRPPPAEVPSYAALGPSAAPEV